MIDSSNLIQAWNTAGQVRCPVCWHTGNENHSDMCHPAKVRVNAGGKITEVTHSQTLRSIGPASGRGASIAIVFDCEHGHEFEHRFQFHKGTTWTEIAVLNADHVDEDGVPILRTIWRN